MPSRRPDPPASSPAVGGSGAPVGGGSAAAVGERFQSLYDAHVARVEAALEGVLPPGGRWPGPIYEAMRYSVFSGGKRLRPVLVRAACEAAGGDPDQALAPACAVELVHAYSLVHDDLPAMDDDAVRRGRPTTHVAYGEALAILAGDALLTLAFECLTDPAWKLSPATVGELMRELSGAAGTGGLIAGQVADLAAEGSEPDAGEDVNETDADELERIHRHKTGALLRACVRMGVLTAPTPEPTILSGLSGFAQHFGLAFQIVDDILDVAGDERATGRPAGSDRRRDKRTFVSLYGVDGSRRRARDAIEAGRAELSAVDGPTDFLADLATFVLLRDG